MCTKMLFLSSDIIGDYYFVTTKFSIITFLIKQHNNFGGKNNN